MIDTHYETLGIEPTASQAEVKSAARKLLLMDGIHPDKGGNPAIFRRVNEAKRVLSDPDLRAAYDEEIASTSTRSSGRSGPTGSRSEERPRAHAANEEAPLLAPSPPRLSYSWSGTGTEVDVVPPFLTSAHRRLPLLVMLGLVVAVAMTALLVPAPMNLIVCLAIGAVGVPTVRAFRGRNRAHAAFDEELSAALVVDADLYGSPGGPDEFTRLAVSVTRRTLEPVVPHLPGTKILSRVVLASDAPIAHLVLLRGNRCAVVQPMPLQSGTYTSGGGGELLRNGLPFLGGHVDLADTVQSFRSVLGKRVTVHGFGVGLGVSGARPRIDIAQDRNATYVVADDAVESVGSFLSGAPAAVDRFTLRRLLVGLAR